MRTEQRETSQYYEAYPDDEYPADVWRVMAIGYDIDIQECVIFCGPTAERRAKAYAAWMNGDDE